MKRILSIVLALFLLCSFSVGLADPLSSVDAIELLAAYSAWAKYYEVKDFEDDMQNSVNDGTGTYQIDALAINYTPGTYEIEQAILVYEMPDLSIDGDTRAVAFFSAIICPRPPERFLEVEKEAKELLGELRFALPTMENAKNDEIVLFALTDDCGYSFIKSDGILAIVAI